MCTPDAIQEPAPKEGETGSYDAGEAGTVDIERTSPTELRFVQATENADWTHQVTTETGPRVKVKFTNAAGPPWVVRFAASMDQSGQEIHIRVSTCQ